MSFALGEPPAWIERINEGAVNCLFSEASLHGPEEFNRNGGVTFEVQMRPGVSNLKADRTTTFVFRSYEWGTLLFATHLLLPPTR